MNGIDINNFETLPEGFLLVMVLMAAVGIGLLVFFIKKQWLWVRNKNNEGESVHEVNVREQKNRDQDKKSHISYTVFKKD
jgi:hypothetical protein